jgi:hypothetical protein
MLEYAKRVYDKFPDSGDELLKLKLNMKRHYTKETSIGKVNSLKELLIN